jgi:hypothetical protein
VLRAVPANPPYLETALAEAVQRGGGVALSVLRQPFGGLDVQRGQLERLLNTGDLRHMEIQVMPTTSQDHAGMGGPLTLLTPKGKPQVAYLEVQHISRLITDPDEVRVLGAKYGSIRGQALTPRESLRLIEKILGDL